MKNYHKPYRGLPAEIRVQIWRLVIPEQVTILKDTPPWGDSQPSMSANNLKLFPPLQTQLLLLDRAVYNEALPILKETEIRLRTRGSYTYVWPMFNLAMQSPASGVLEYTWSKTPSDSGHRDAFLTRFIDVRSPHPLRKLIVRIKQAGLETEIVKNNLPYDFFGHTGPTVPPETIKELKDYEVIAPFAGASLLVEGLVADQVVVIIERISHGELPHWTPKPLRQCMTLDPAADDPMFLDHGFLPDREKNVRMLFYRAVPDRMHVASLIHIDVEFVETSEIGVFTGRVIFSKIDEAQDGSSSTDDMGP